MSGHRKISIYNVSKTFSQEELKRNQQIGKLKMYLGIYPVLDSGFNEDIRVPSMYKSVHEYEADKQYAENCLCNGIKIPDAIVQKLVAARKELETAGVLQPLT